MAHEKIHGMEVRDTERCNCGSVRERSVSRSCLSCTYEEKIHEIVWTFRGSLDKRDRTGDDVMKRGIIFDMDGTLWDSAENVAKSWNVAIRQQGSGRKN